MLEISEKQNFLGKTLVACDGYTEITVTLDVGPRIIGLRPKNGFNVMYEDIHDRVVWDCSPFYGENKLWHLYGGHRLWLSPEDLSSYYPDDKPVSYTVNGDSVTFAPPRWERVDIQPSITVTFLGKEGLSVTHTVLNTGKKRDLCLWAITSMKAGGTFSLSLSSEDTGFVPNRNIVLWPYDSLTDKRFTLKDDVATVKSDISVPGKFKIGAYCDDVCAKYELEENGVKQMFIKRAAGTKNARYPDFYCNAEMYCTNLIHEIETLSPIIETDTGETITHTELWQIR